MTDKFKPPPHQESELSRDSYRASQGMGADLDGYDVLRHYSGASYPLNGAKPADINKFIEAFKNDSAYGTFQIIRADNSETRILQQNINAETITATLASMVSNHRTHQVVNKAYAEHKVAIAEKLTNGRERKTASSPLQWITDIFSKPNN